VGGEALSSLRSARLRVRAPNTVRDDRARVTIRSRSTNGASERVRARAGSRIDALVSQRAPSTAFEGSAGVAGVSVIGTISPAVGVRVGRASHRALTASAPFTTIGSKAVYAVSVSGTRAARRPVEGWLVSLAGVVACLTGHRFRAPLALRIADALAAAFEDVARAELGSSASESDVSAASLAVVNRRTPITIAISLDASSAVGELVARGAFLKFPG